MSVTLDMKPVWNDLQKAINGALSNAILLIEREVVLEIERDGLQVTGGLKEKVYSTVDESTMTAIVGNNYKSAVYTHEGTKPHWAPLDELRMWVKNKFNLTGKELEKRSRAVWVSIARKGTKAHPFFTNAIEKWVHKIPQVLRDEIAKRMA